MVPGAERVRSWEHAPFLSTLRRAIDPDRAELIKDLVRDERETVRSLPRRTCNAKKRGG